MRVELRRSGGFAAPALARPIVLDTAGLGDQQTARVRRTVEAARACLADAARDGAAPTVGADLISYTVTISDDEAAALPAGNSAGALTFSDPIPEPALAALIDAITELGEAQQR